MRPAWIVFPRPTSSAISTSVASPARQRQRGLELVRQQVDARVGRRSERAAREPARRDEGPRGLQPSVARHDPGRPRRRAARRRSNGMQNGPLAARCSSRRRRPDGRRRNLSWAVTPTTRHSPRLSRTRSPGFGRACVFCDMEVRRSAQDFFKNAAANRSSSTIVARRVPAAPNVSDEPPHASAGRLGTVVCSGRAGECEEAGMRRVRWVSGLLAWPRSPFPRWQVRPPRRRGSPSRRC